jgi:hypothetical protein
MNTSKPGSAFAWAWVLACVACGSSFQANDTSAGGSSAQGGSSAAAGSVSGGGRSGQGGRASGGGVGIGGDVSIGGGIGVGGDVSIGGDIGIAGSISSGGVVGSSGSTSSGGMSGGSPTGGSAGTSPSGGAAGGGGADCNALWNSYMDLVAKTEVCDAGSTVECVANSNIVNQCNCPIPVNHNSPSLEAAKKALQNWKDAGCVFKACLCVAQGSPTCQLVNNAYICQGGPLVTPN